uniref:Putative 5.3 kDa protein n=1 Tax=Ixodes ricinus TaxID=34613 RepID=A0A0K8REW2_IXORI
MRALIICCLLLLHGMMVWAQLGFPRPGEQLFPKCKQPCVGRPKECPKDCNQCLQVGRTPGRRCVSRGGGFWWGGGR